MFYIFKITIDINILYILLIIYINWIVELT